MQEVDTTGTSLGLSYAFCLPHSCQLGALFLVCLYCNSAGAFIDKSFAIQSVSRAVNPHRERCAGRLAVLDRAAELIERLA